jgi:pyrroloquinoline quinone (PQQ) biosynthesis protein C
MDTTSVIKIEAAMKESLTRISDHRFIRMAHQRELSREQVIRWILCAGRESETFPNILVRMLERITEPQLVVDILNENLNDEYGNGNPDDAHFRHYIHLLHEVELSEQDFRAYSERAGIRLALDLAANVSVQPVPEIAIGYMLVNEGMTPITYGAVDVAIHKYFPNLDNKFFQLHVEVDEHHVRELYRAVATLDESAMDDLLFGVALGERGMAVLLDEALGVFDSVS